MPLGRPPKWKRVESMPEITYFKPAGIPLSSLEEICISVEEAESLRLKDWEGLEQEECAGRMSISRPTFQRILSAARHKLADALLHGKAIRIEGGNYEMAVRRYRCLEGHEWDVDFDAMVQGPPKNCPTCNMPDPMPMRPGRGHGGGGRGRRGGRCWKP